MNLVMPFELLSIFVFALSGALAASRAQLDLIGFVFLACITALGGGTLRDLLLDRPMAWIESPHFLGLAAVAAIIVFFTAHLLESRIRTLRWFDAIALAVAVPAGVGAALGLGHSWPIALVMGVLTGCFGGLMRDVICNEVPLVLKHGELYVTCAVAGSISALIARYGIGLPYDMALVACAVITFALRAGSLLVGWQLPVYKARPPRN